MLKNSFPGKWLIFHYFRLNHKESGSAITQILIGFAILSAISTGLLYFSNYLMSQASRIKANSSRETLINQVQNYILLPKSLVKSAALPVNKELRACTFGGALDTCIENCCQDSSIFDFYFVDPTSTENDISQKRRLTGTTVDPVFYYPNGQPCQPNSPNDFGPCAYSLTTSFSPHCPAGIASCDHAEHFMVTITLTPNPTVALIRPRTMTLIYFVEVNYKPSIAFLNPIDIYLGETPPEVTVAVNGLAGHPSEDQNFRFTKCEITPAGVAQLLTPSNQPFANGVSQIKIQGLSAGNTQLKLQISDGGLENDLSDPVSVLVRVIDGTKP